MAGRLDGKVALVTGGNSGIGQATAIAFAREGANVVIAARREPEGEETVRLIKESAGEACFVQTDVSRATDVEAMVQRTVEAYGRLDYAFNNAGTGGTLGPTADCTEENWDRVIGVNLKGLWLCMKYEIQHMRESSNGAIVNMASVMGLVGGANYPAYVASKHGVVGLTKAAALENAKAGIRINAVCPATIRTPEWEHLYGGSPTGIAEAEARSVARTPLGRLGTLEEIADSVVWLCSDTASYITGHALPLDGGWIAQ